MKKLIWPDYEQCITDIPNSILKKFGCEPVGKTSPLLDQYLKKDYKNVVLLLLDGMGSHIIDRHLVSDGPFRSHMKDTLHSVFLSTTVASTTSALSGLQPCEHAWLGWDCYYPQIEKNVTVFLNTIQGTDETAADYNVARTYTPYENVQEKIQKAGGSAYTVATFLPPFPKTIEAVCEGIREACNHPEPKYVYAYFNQPDGLLHDYGCGSKEAHEELVHIEQVVSELTAGLSDTLFIITADHGHIDNRIMWIQDYPKLMDCLVRLPALEPRVLNFFIKEGMHETFEKEFRKEFGDSFVLLTKEEVFRRKLFGTGKPHPCFEGMLGDYLAIAVSDISIFCTDSFLSMHGSITEDEVEIPLIIFGE